MKRLTLEEIGKLAGVSRSTVSRVINNYPHINPEIRQRVEQIINDTGYQPNSAARSLASSRTQVIGFFIPNTVANIFADPYFPKLIQGVSRACNAANYTLALYLFHTLEEQQRTVERVVNSYAVDGLILSADRDDDGLIALLRERGLRFVMVGRPDDDLSIHYIDVDNFNGAYTAARHLIRLGYQRIGLVTSDRNNAGRDRGSGFYRALNEQNCPADKNLIAYGDFTEESGYYAMKQMLQYRPDAIFAVSDLMAFGAIRAITEAGLQIPDDIAVIGFDDITPAATQSLPLTTIRQPVNRLGIMAAEMLIDVVSTEYDVPRRVILPTELVIRATCGAEQLYSSTEQGGD